MTVDRGYRFKSQWRRGQRQEMLARCGSRCQMCGTPDRPGCRLHQAHHVSAGPGVPNDSSNVAAMLCASCHRRWDAARTKASRA